MHEARNPSRLLDAWWIKFFHQLPWDCKEELLHPIEKELIMYMVAGAPDDQAIAMLFQYEKEKAAIEDKPLEFWLKEVRQMQISKQSGIMPVLMKQQGFISESLFLKSQAEQLKASLLKDLRKKYSRLFDMDDEEEDPRKAAIERNQEITHRLNRGGEYAEKYKKLLDTVRSEDEKEKGQQLPEWTNQFPVVPRNAIEDEDHGPLEHGR